MQSSKSLPSCHYNAHLYWLVISWQEFPESLAWVMLFLAMVFLPLYIATNHNDVGGDAHFT
jgi:hypothetical protein